MNFFEKDTKTAMEAIDLAQWIAFAPVVFQASIALRDLGILEVVEQSKTKGIPTRSSTASPSSTPTVPPPSTANTPTHKPRLRPRRPRRRPSACYGPGCTTCTSNRPMRKRTITPPRPGHEEGILLQGLTAQHPQHPGASNRRRPARRLALHGRAGHHCFGPPLE